MEDHKQIAVGGKRKAGDHKDDNDGAKRLCLITVPPAIAPRIWPHQRILNGELCDHVPALNKEDAESAVMATFHELQQIPLNSTIGKLCKGLEGLFKFYYAVKWDKMWHFFAYLFAGQPLAYFCVSQWSHRSKNPFNEINWIFTKAWKNQRGDLFREFTRAEFRCLLDALLPFGFGYQDLEGGDWIYYGETMCHALVHELYECPDRYRLDGSVMAKRNLPRQIYTKNLQNAFILMRHLTQEDWMDMDDISDHALRSLDVELFRRLMDAAISADGLQLKLFDGVIEERAGIILIDGHHKLELLAILGRKRQDLYAQYVVLAADLLILFRCPNTSIALIPHELLNVIGQYAFDDVVWRIIYTELLSVGIAAPKC